MFNNVPVVVFRRFVLLLLLLLNVDKLPGFVFAFRLYSVLLDVDVLPRRLRLR